jgi:hypothetical protein
LHNGQGNFPVVGDKVCLRTDQNFNGGFESFGGIPAGYATSKFYTAFGILDSAIRTETILSDSLLWMSEPPKSSQDMIVLKTKKMIDNILNLLQLAKQEGWQGENIDIALGKNKFPQSLKEAIKQLRHETN